MRNYKDKIKTREELVKIVKDAQEEGKKVGYSSGAFDLMHGGHVDYLVKAKALCDIFIIGVNTDNSVKNYKDPKRPICNCEDRTDLIAALECVDYVFNFDELNNNVNIMTLKPDFYIKAGDYDMSRLSSAPLIESYGGKVELIPVVKDVSTTKVIKKIIDLYGVEGCTSYDESIKYEKRPAVFLDRDGVINEEIEYLSEPEKFKLLPNVAEGIKAFQDMGYRIIVVTNQPGIGLGYYTKEDFFKVTKQMFKELSPHGICFDKIYYSPHSKSDNSTWRKPDIGMILQAKKDLNVDLENSFLIGDKTLDIKCAKNAGVKSILVKTGAAGTDKLFDVPPDFVADDLLEASKIVKNLKS
ncbi:MAG: HAD-IIIA family hydrolase [Bdellovibrionota bacterium]